MKRNRPPSRPVISFDRATRMARLSCGHGGIVPSDRPDPALGSSMYCLICQKFNQHVPKNSRVLASQPEKL